MNYEEKPQWKTEINYDYNSFVSCEVLDDGTIDKALFPIEYSRAMLVVPDEKISSDTIDKMIELLNAGRIIKFEYESGEVWYKFSKEQPPEEENIISIDLVREDNADDVEVFDKKYNSVRIFFLTPEGETFGENDQLLPIDSLYSMLLSEAGSVRKANKLVKQLNKGKRIEIDAGEGFDSFKKVFILSEEEAPDLMETISWYFTETDLEHFFDK